MVASIRFKIKNLNEKRSYDMNGTYEIRTESVKIGPGLDGYLAHPVLPGNYPGIVVCMEIFGVTEHMRNIAERLAKRGYITFVPNFYWRARLSADLPHDAQGREEGMHLKDQLHRESVLEDVTTAMTFLRNDENCSGRMGIVGFSLGGHIAYLAATQLNLQAAASFYGGWIVNGGIPLSSPNPPITLTEGMAQRDVRFLGIVGGHDHVISA
jgi:carboxymethylenebutenolidase